MITYLFNLILSIFKKEKKENRNETDQFRTPPRKSAGAQFRTSNRDFKGANVRSRRFNSYPSCLPSRLPESFPLIRNRSQISLQESRENKGTPFRPQGISRVRGSTTNLQNVGNDSFDLSFSETSAMNARRDDKSLEFRDIKPSRNPNSILDFHSITGDQMSLPLKNGLDFGEFLNTRKSRLGNNNADAPTSMNDSYSKPNDMRRRRFNSVPNPFPSALPESCPPIRVPSQTSLLGLNKNTPFTTKGIARTKGSSTNLRTLANHSLDSIFLESDNINARTEDSTQAFRHVPTHKDSELSFEFRTAAEDQQNMQSNGSLEFYDAFSMRSSQLKNNPYSTPGCSFPLKHAYSKIPKKAYSSEKQDSPKTAEFMKFSKRLRGTHTLSSNKRNSYGMTGFQDKGDIADLAHIKPTDISNWITFRNDTSMKFEQVYKSLSKKKHHPIGKIIDATTHAQWMKLAGITVDKDALMFKNFAGGKVVLTFGEYKFLISKICTTHELDYWDVLRKMATFQDELQHEDGLEFC